MRIAFRASPETIINTHMGAQSGRSPSESSNCVFQLFLPDMRKCFSVLNFYCVGQRNSKPLRRQGSPVNSGVTIIRSISQMSSKHSISSISSVSSIRSMSSISSIGSFSSTQKTIGSPKFHRTQRTAGIPKFHRTQRTARIRNGTSCCSLSPMKNFGFPGLPVVL